jgi:Kef-type K+ transport system membrane component KefB
MQQKRLKTFQHSMNLLHALDFSLPLGNPVLIFSLILFIILFAPIILNKFKIPHLIGLIIAGALIGPNGLNLMLRDSSIILFGTVGLLYIMFLAGLEIDMADFKKNSSKSLVFGLLTFIIPMGLGTAAGLYVLNFSLATSVLLASMFASHTLIAYPIVSKLGIAKNKAVNITVGGTMITDTLALLVLAVIAGMSTGELNDEFWIRLGISVVIFALIVMLLFPIIGRWFFKRFDDNISQYIFVLGMVFLGAFLAEAAGIEAIIGAFLAGLALNRLIPHTSPLMNRIEFVGNALFIPFFLIGVGMLIDYRAFIKDIETIKVAAVMTIIAISSKFFAAFITQKIYGYNADERRLIFGLSSAQAAATLAAVLVGYNIILNQSEIDVAALEGEVIEPVRLLSESVLNGTILMILITCTVASFVAQKGAQNLAVLDDIDDDNTENEATERILLPLSNVEDTSELINLSLALKSKKNVNGIYALNIIDNSKQDGVAEKQAHKILEKAAEEASAADVNLQELMRYDLNIVNGISSVVKEHKITDIILGLHKQKLLSESFLGYTTESILSKTNATTLIYKSVQPLSTVKRNVVIIPEKAEKEIGFPFWLVKVWNIGKNTGAKLVIYASQATINYLKEVNKKHPVDIEFNEFSDWEDFLIISRDVKKDDNILIIMSRKNHLSFTNTMNKIPTYLNKYFSENNFLLIYPMQLGVFENERNNLKNPSVLEPLQENLERLDEIGKTITKIFKRK